MAAHGGPGDDECTGLPQYRGTSQGDGHSRWRKYLSTRSRRVPHPHEVLDLADAFFGEELLAVVRLTEGSDVTEQELREFCKGKISHQKIPRYFQFVDTYPMTASGKVQKFVLREHAILALGLQEIATIKRV